MFQVRLEKQYHLGDLEEFENLFRQFFQPLVLFANKFIYDLDLAENIVQDVFMNIWMNREQIDFKGNLKTYLYTSVKNRAINSVKHSKIEREYKEKVRIVESDFNTPETEFDLQEMEKDINKVIQNLPDKCRLIFLMSRNDHLTYAEIAEILGISIKTVENQMGKALKALRTRLSELSYASFY